jgi:hypothetical protein
MMASEVMDLPEPAFAGDGEGFATVQGEGEVLDERAKARFGADRDGTGPRRRRTPSGAVAAAEMFAGSARVIRRRSAGSRS